MVSKAKLYSQLDRMQDELRERIVSHLESAVTGNNDLIFCTTEFNPFPELKSSVDTETESLIHLGRRILSLMEKLGEPSDNSIAERLCWYCRKWGDTGDKQRKSAQGFAREFLNEIEN